MADIALWQLDTPTHAGIDDPVAALLLGAPPPLRLLLVNGRTVVEHDTVRTVDEDSMTVRVAQACRKVLTP
jgi:hypothetical protein